MPTPDSSQDLQTDYEGSHFLPALCVSWGHGHLHYNLLYVTLITHTGQSKGPPINDVLIWTPSPPFKQPVRTAYLQIRAILLTPSHPCGYHIWMVPNNPSMPSLSERGGSFIMPQRLAPPPDAAAAGDDDGVLRRSYCFIAKFVRSFRL